MKLNNHQSETIRRLAANCLAEAAVRENALADEVSPWMSPATVNRLLQTGGPSLTTEQADILLHGLARFVSFDPQQVFQDKQGPLEGAIHPVINELPYSRSLRFDNDGIDEIVSTIDRAASASKRLWTFAWPLPLFLLDDDLADLLLAQRVQRFSRNPGATLTRLREETRRQREDFMNFAGIGGITDIRVVAGLSSFVRFARGLAPLSTQWSEEIEESLESIIHDALLERGLNLYALDDLHDGPARRWIWQHDGFAAITVFDQGVVIKRKRGSLAARILDASHSAAAKQLVDGYRSTFLEAESLACHGQNPIQAAEFLRGFIEVARGSRGTGPGGVGGVPNPN